jgi:hypothetical protein
MNYLPRQETFHRSTQVDIKTGLAFVPDLMDEVVAGLLWMSLDLPEDVSRPEVERLAHHLVLRIKAHDERISLEQAVAYLQLEQFGRPPDFAAIRDLVGRAVKVVKRL